MSDTVIFTKACDCQARATTGALRLGETYREGGMIRIPVSLIPGPSCDKCGMPWTRRVEPAR